MTEEQFSFPKAELHCHLDGCVRLSTIIEFAKKRGISLPSYDIDELRSKVCNLTRKKSLAEYLHIFEILTPTYAGCREGIERITREAIEDKATDGVRYVELRYCPHLFSNCDVSPLRAVEKGDVTPRDVVDIVCKAGAQAQLDFGIHVKFILCCIISFPDWSMEVAKLCEEFAGRGVVGIDVAGSGDDEGLEILAHKEAFDYCKNRGIHITAHAGEAGGACEVQNAMETLHAERIGHGYHVVDDEDIYVEAKEKNVHFEVCPLSSYLTASVDPDLTRHPAIRFMKDGINFSLSTDDPGCQQSNLLDDYKIALTKFNFTVDQLKKLNLNALRSSFCDAGLKEELISEFETTYLN